MSDTTNSSPATPYHLSVQLAFPDLYPQAVMYAIFDFDPKPEYNRSRPDGLPDARLFQHFAALDASRFAASWDRLFERTSGNKMHLAVPLDNPKPASDSGTGMSVAQVTRTVMTILTTEAERILKKWLVTRSSMHRDKAIAWCMPLEIARGSTQNIVLTKDNAIDLQTTT